MSTINLSANYGYYDFNTDSRANLYFLENYIHGSPKDSPPKPGYFSLRSETTFGNFPHVAITLNTPPNSSFTVSVDMNLQALATGASATFVVWLNPDNTANQYQLPPIYKNSSDNNLAFDVRTTSPNGIYYVDIYCLTLSPISFSIFDIAVLQ
jgi:hypothetical protein